MGYLIGADIGSQSVKAVLLDPDGQLVASAGQGCVMTHPASGWAEQDPADWQTGLTIAVRQLVTRSGVAPSQITHLGLASQVDGVVPVERVVETHAHAITGLLLVENPGFVSGGSTLWCARSVLGTDQAGLFELAARAPVGARGVVFVPALSGATVPRWNDRMRGVFAGLAMNHDRGHLARAVVEGCSFALRDVLGRLDALGLADREIRVVGGGARSALWLQIKADVTGRPVRPVLTGEPTALGAAILAGLAAGTFRDVADAVERTVTPSAWCHEPDDRTRAVYAVYEERYAQYRALYDGVEGALT